MTNAAPPTPKPPASYPARPAPNLWTPWVARLTLALLVLLLLAAGGAAAGWWWVQRANPLVDATLHLGTDRGLEHSVNIERDAHGIPSIEAQSVEDAMFALGVVHAQDRLWQMEVHRRIGAGRLAEAFGAAAIGNDRFLRALGIRRAAEAQWANVGEESRRLLTSYAAGVNFVTARQSVLPPEFLLTGIRPEPWTPVDSLSWTLMMAWDLGGNWTTELQRLRLASALPTGRILEVLPATAGTLPASLRDFSALYRSLGLASPEGDPSAASRNAAAVWDSLLALAPPSGIEGTGSNNWVLGPERSSTRGAVVANDPHLGLSTPALWYVARIKAPGLEVAGATLPGVPLVVLGQNRDLAWGFTNTGPDVQDLYLEALDPDDPGRYRTPSGTAAFDTREEIIQVKGAPAVHLTVRATRHGPVLSDAATWTDLEPSLTASRHVIALRWTALEPDTDMVAAGLALARAQTTEQFIRASRLWLAPMQNMVVADRRGTIAMVAAGRVPVRRSDNDLWGMAPAPGWESRYDWVGWIPYDETPRLLDPPIGFIATANQRIHEPGYPHFLGTDWALPYRQQRIEQLLDLKVRHNLDDLRAIQQDEVSLAARALIPWFRRARSNHPLAELVRTAQEQFDGQMRAEDAAPLIFWAWHRALSQRLLSQRIGMSLYERLIQQRSFQDLLESVLASNDPFWCDDRNTQVLDSCQHQADAALGDALSELSDRFGRSPDQWRWSAAHQAVGEHRPMSRVALLRDHFETRTGVGGDTFTVNATRVGLGPTPPGRYSASHGPSLKALYDVKAPENSRIVHSTGQSGLPWNAHYRDLLPRWKSGDGIPLWRPADQEPVAVLRLVP